MEVRTKGSPPYSQTQSERAEGWQGKASLVRSFDKQYCLYDNFVGSVRQKCRAELRIGQRAVVAVRVAYVCACYDVDQSRYRP